jgi:hypothetical protein
MPIKRTQCLSLFIAIMLTLQGVYIQAHLLLEHHEGVAHSHVVDNLKSVDHHSDNGSTNLDHHHSDHHPNDAPSHPKEDHEFRLLPYNASSYALHFTLSVGVVVFAERAPKKINLRIEEKCLHPPRLISHPPQSPRAPPVA